MVERLVRDQEAVGSNPTSPIIFIRHRFSSNSEICVNLRNLWMRISESAPNERNSPHYNYHNRIWDRVFHAAIPTHWLPFVLTARAQRWNRTKTLMITALAGSGHVLFTATLGSLVAWLGIELSARIGIWFPRIAGDRFQIHHTTLQFETPDHECSLAPEEKV